MVRTCPGRPEVRNWPSCVTMAAPESALCGWIGVIFLISQAGWNRCNLIYLSSSALSWTIFMCGSNYVIS